MRKGLLSGKTAKIPTSAVKVTTLETEKIGRKPENSEIARSEEKYENSSDSLLSKSIKYKVGMAIEAVNILLLMLLDLFELISDHKIKLKSTAIACTKSQEHERH